MSSIITLHSVNLARIRTTTEIEIEHVIREAIVATVAEVGAEGFKAFFDGYKTPVDLMKAAA